MKTASYFLSLILLTSGLLACSKEEKVPEKRLLLSELSQNHSGVWLNKLFLDQLFKTRSVASAHRQSPFCLLKINIQSSEEVFAVEELVFGRSVPYTHHFGWDSTGQVLSYRYSSHPSMEVLSEGVCMVSCPQISFDSETQRLIYGTTDYTQKRFFTEQYVRIGSQTEIENGLDLTALLSAFVFEGVFDVYQDQKLRFEQVSIDSLGNFTGFNSYESIKLVYLTNAQGNIEKDHAMLYQQENSGVYNDEKQRLLFEFIHTNDGFSLELIDSNKAKKTGSKPLRHEPLRYDFVRRN